jgi:AcrR family transcriptional regulator
MLQASEPYSRDEILSHTQRRIIEAAGEIFADSGYRHTTVRAICRQAGVNVAAVNYHFGGKKHLYLAVLRYSRSKAMEEHPFDLEDFATGTPASRLHAFIRTLLARVLDKGVGSRFARLMAKELMQPTSAFDQIIKEVINPSFAFLSVTIEQLFGKPLPTEKAGLYCISIVGQIFYFYLSTPVIRTLLRKESFDADEIAAIADHITRFSLYAIERMAAEDEGEGR